MPDGYASMTAYTKSISSSQENKWLFDVVYLSSIVMFINFHVARVLKADSFIGFRVLDETFGYSNNSKAAKVFYYGLFIFYVINMNSQSAETMRELIEQQRPFWGKLFDTDDIFLLPLFFIGGYGFGKKKRLTIKRRIECTAIQFALIDYTTFNS